MPQVIVNKEKWKEEIEGLELSRLLPKHLPTELAVEHVPSEQVLRPSLGDCEALAPRSARFPSFVE